MLPGKWGLKYSGFSRPQLYQRRSGLRLGKQLIETFFIRPTVRFTPLHVLLRSLLQWQGCGAYCGGRLNDRFSERPIAARPSVCKVSGSLPSSLPDDAEVLKVAWGAWDRPREDTGTGDHLAGGGCAIHGHKKSRSGEPRGRW
jgi:hypothetical protein